MKLPQPFGIFPSSLRVTPAPRQADKASAPSPPEHRTNPSAPPRLEKMATLPPGWAADYDGQRWFFKYAATNHVQYHFPKAGDEFPDFASFGDGLDCLSLTGVMGAAELLPEERLESERQVRRHETMDSNSKNEARRNTRKRRSERVDEKEEDGGGVFTFESFGYLGPGSYEEVMSPTADENSFLGGKSEKHPSHGVVSNITSPTSAGVDNTPPVSVSEPSAAAFTIVGDDPVKQARHSPARYLAWTSAAEFVLSEPTTTTNRANCSPDPPEQDPLQPEIPMLDGREIAFSPVGHLAELVSESTGRCEEEINPAPVELPDNGASWLEPVPVPNLVNQYPVELPTFGSAGTKTQNDEPKRSDDKKVEDNHVISGLAQEPREPFIVAGGEGDRNSDERVLRTRRMIRPAAGMDMSIQKTQSTSQATHINSRFDLPSRQSAPKIPPKVPHDERLHQEILNFFPEGSEALRSLAASVEDPASAPNKGTEARRRGISPGARLGPVPSVLRPGPRRSSQPFVPMPETVTSTGAKFGPVPSVLRPGPRRSSQPPRPGFEAGRDGRPASQPPVTGLGIGTAADGASTSPPGDVVTYRPFQPTMTKQNNAPGVRTHSSSVGERPFRGWNYTAAYQPLRPPKISATDRTQSSPDVPRPAGAAGVVIDNDFQSRRPREVPFRGRLHSESAAARPYESADRADQYQTSRVQKPPAAGTIYSTPNVERPHGSTGHAEQDQPSGSLTGPVTGRPQSQSLGQRHDPHDSDVVLMPDPNDHVRALRFPRSGTLPLTEELPPSPRTVGPTASPGRDARSGAYSTPGQGHERGPPPRKLEAQAQHPLGAEMPEEPSRDGGEHAGASGFVRMPPEPTVGHDDDIPTRRRPAPLQLSSAPLLPRRAPIQPSPPLRACPAGENKRYPARTSPRSENLPTARRPWDRDRDPVPGPASPGGCEPCSPPASPRNTKIGQMLKRIARPAREDGSSGGGGEPIRVIGEDWASESAMGYMPPKGKQGEAPEWSWGNAE